jgi:glycosyltransferase involved in cell wall biosynthesis
VHFTATFIGSPLPEDEEWYAALKQQATELGVNEGVLFQPGIPNARTPEAYHSHELFVNASRSGMFDKTLFEAAASGCIVLASSEDFEAAAGETFHFTSAAELAERIERIFQESADDRARMAERMQALARAESLATLCDSLVRELYSANI